MLDLFPDVVYLQDGDSETSEEFVLEGDTENEEEDEDASRMMDAPTLACDMIDDVQDAPKHQVGGKWE